MQQNGTYSNESILAPFSEIPVAAAYLTDVMVLSMYCCCRTDVVEFVSTEHTPRNLLIRAVKETAGTSASIGSSRGSSPTASSSDGDSIGVRPAHAKLIEEYVALKEMWGVEPFLEGLLEDVLPPAVRGSG